MALDKSKRLNDLTADEACRTMGCQFAGLVQRQTGCPARFLGGDTASTGVKTRGMHAEPHRLVNPMEHNVTADTQLALAA